MNNGQVLALIPARSGSKRVKNKNLKLLAGRPLITYTIKAALKASSIDRVVVSTDCEKIAQIAQLAGADVPFLRPKELAGTNSTEYEFHEHALSWLKENEKYEPELIVNLYPTSPFRSADTIDNAVKLFKENEGSDSLRSVVKCTEHPYKMWVRDGNKFLKPFVQKDDGAVHTLSYQALPEVFIQNASIYITTLKTLKKFKNTVGEKIVMFEMSNDESVDINYPQDFQLAEIKMNPPLHQM